ncbi:MAG: hypothetical protein ACO1OC_00645 [Tuberibacillus sp.]
MFDGNEERPVSSFVLRFYPNENESSFPWRIKVTDVQNGKEESFDSLKEMADYMRQILGSD